MTSEMFLVARSGVVTIVSIAANRLIVQSQRRPLLGPSPG